MELSVWVQFWWRSHAVSNVRQTERSQCGSCYACCYLEVKLSFCLVRQNVVKAYGGVEMQFRTFLKFE